ncbi:MAG TPA: MaoC family dehydratase N-terminal domain-containing protein [Bacillota bacterium]|nr:MaoC family dehydratase N-terminal domain-containing protein [Bacillota bacterium]
MIDRKWEGCRTKPFSFSISRELIQEYANVIYDNHPIYHDVEAARAKGYPDLVAPATLPIICWQHASIPWLEHAVGLVHREQVFTYQEPLYAGQQFICEIHLKKIEEKQHAGKRIQFLKHELIGFLADRTNSSKPVFTCSSVLILQEEGMR